MKKIGKKILATMLSLTLIIGFVGVVEAQATGTDVSAGKGWKSFSIHGADGGDNSEDPTWEKKLTNPPSYTKATPQKWCIDSSEEVIKAAGGDLDAKWTYGECGKITSQTASSFEYNVVSSGWSGSVWKEDGTCTASNPWGLTATKVVSVERGRYYNISFKIKSTLKNEVNDGLHEITVNGKKVNYTKGTGEINYIKHFHIKAYDDRDTSGAALPLYSIKANCGSKNALTVGKDFNNLIAMDSRDNDYVTVTAQVLVPQQDSQYQEKVKAPTMGIKFAFGAFMAEYNKENNMNGKIEVKDFKVTAGNKATGAAKAKIKKVKAGKKSLTIKYKASGAKKYQIQVALKKNFKKGLKTKTTKKTSITIKGLKKKKKYYVRVRGAKGIGGAYVFGAASKVKSKKTK